MHTKGELNARIHACSVFFFMGVLAPMIWTINFIKKKHHFHLKYKDSPDKRVKIEYPHCGFILTNSHETLGIIKGFGVSGLFSSGSYRLPMVEKHKQFEKCYEKKY